PEGWTVTASGRSGGIWARPPRPRSEADYRVFLDWIVERDEPARDRLLAVTQRALGDLQAAIAEETGVPWPVGAGSDGNELAPAHAVVAGDDVNPLLRLFYGDPDGPVLENPHPGLVNMLVEGWG